MNVTFISSEQVAHNIHTFYFKPDQTVRYIPGQFIELQLPHSPVDQRGEKRWFTLSSYPSEPLLAITTTVTHVNPSSFKQSLVQLQAGSEATISLPMGDFVLPKDASIPLLFIAGGVGITPFRSIISDLQQREQSRDITLIYAAHNKDEHAFKETFEFLGSKFIPVTTRDTNSVNYGALHAEQIVKLAQPTAQHYTYVSGPEAMVETLTNDLAAHGIERRRIFTDYFHGYVID